MGRRLWEYQHLCESEAAMLLRLWCNSAPWGWSIWFHFFLTSKKVFLTFKSLQIQITRVYSLATFDTLQMEGEASLVCPMHLRRINAGTCTHACTQTPLFLSKHTALCLCHTVPVRISSCTLPARIDSCLVLFICCTAFHGMVTPRLSSRVLVGGHLECFPLSSSKQNAGKCLFPVLTALLITSQEGRGALLGLLDKFVCRTVRRNSWGTEPVPGTFSTIFLALKVSVPFKNRVWDSFVKKLRCWQTLSLNCIWLDSVALARVSPTSTPLLSLSSSLSLSRLSFYSPSTLLSSYWEICALRHCKAFPRPWSRVTSTSSSRWSSREAWWLRGHGAASLGTSSKWFPPMFRIRIIQVMCGAHRKVQLVISISVWWPFPALSAPIFHLADICTMPVCCPLGECILLHMYSPVMKIPFLHPFSRFSFVTGQIGSFLCGEGWAYISFLTVSV